jgi:hypothetical protein
MARTSCLRNRQLIVLATAPTNPSREHRRAATAAFLGGTMRGRLDGALDFAPAGALPGVPRFGAWYFNEALQPLDNSQRFDHRFFREFLGGRY